ncbi:MAG TPA: hypothetical protein DHW82_10970 [Spirochaetia bacterium]|nr:MAG: hypothetical protein A2Y41_01885 [Spirochaetes bacterium GWB1_36_13]HCL57515.1 hypothetical protein [Spirochaetia bacterium]
MKRILLAIFFVFIINLSVFSEENPSEEKLSLGFYFGLGAGSWADVNYDNLPSNLEVSSRWTSVHMVIGTRLNYILTDYFSLNAGFSYTKKMIGYALMTIPSEYTYSENEFSINYFEIPFGLRLGDVFFVGTGGYIGFQLGDSEGKINDITGTVKKEYQKKLDYGLGFETGLKGNGLEFYIRWELGLANVIQKDLDTAGSGISMKNNSILFIFGFDFDL